MFAELPADLDTPLSAYLRLRPGPYSFLLESVEGRRIMSLDHRVGVDQEPVPEVIEDEQGIGEEKYRVGQAEIVLSGTRQPLHVMDHVVREKTDGAALESRQPRHRHGLEFPE